MIDKDTKDWPASYHLAFALSAIFAALVMMGIVVASCEFFSPVFGALGQEFADWIRR